MIEIAVLSFSLVLVRVASFVAFLRPFSTGGIPNTVKIGLAVALTAIWGPLTCSDIMPRVAGAVTGSQAWFEIGWMTVREALVGMGLAWVLGLVFVPLRVAGAYIAQEMGLTMATMASPVDQQNSDVVSQLIEMFGTLLFFALDAPHALFRIAGATLETFPVGTPLQLPSQEWIVGSVAGTERIGLEIAAPIGAGLFITSVLLMVLMRWSPQFNLLTFGSSFRLLAGLLLLAVLLPDLIQRIVILLHHWNPA